MSKADEEDAMCSVYDRSHSWILEAVRKIETPFEVKGRLGLYGLNDDILRKFL